jgi:hypothetical protein
LRGLAFRDGKAFAQGHDRNSHLIKLLGCGACHLVDTLQHIDQIAGILRDGESQFVDGIGALSLCDLGFDAGAAARADPTAPGPRLADDPLRGASGSSLVNALRLL